MAVSLQEGNATGWQAGGETTAFSLGIGEGEVVTYRNDDDEDEVSTGANHVINDTMLMMMTTDFKTMMRCIL